MDERTLAGHTFLYPTLQDGAFGTTHFGIRQGLAFAHIPQVPLGQAGTFDLNMSGLIQQFDLGVKILPWLSLYGNVSGFVLTGIDVDSLVLGGGNVNVTGDGGVFFGIARIEQGDFGFQLAARAYGGAGTGRQINVLPVVNALLQGGQGLNDVLSGDVGKYILTPTTSNEFGGSVHGAAALGRYVGMQAMLGGASSRSTSSPSESGKTVDHTSSSMLVRAGANVDVDGAPAGVPIGAMLEYQMQYENATPDQGSSVSTTQHSLGASIYYTGRKNLVIGVGGITQLGLQPIAGADAAGNATTSGAPSLYFAHFILRYVW